MSNYKLKDEHPFVKKLAQLMDLAESLGISIDFSYCNSRTIIQDTGTNKDYYLQDLDSGTPVTVFPPLTEYKLTYNK
jgi:hypothetical protein